MRRLLLLLLFALPLGAQTARLEDLGWMAGHWGATIDGVVMEEVWLAPAGGVMLSLHRDVKGPRTSFEFARIATTRDGLAFLAQPSGRTPTAFALVETGAQRVVFANPEHDFPNRITYWIAEEKLCAKVEGKGEAEESWCWSRIGG